MGVKIHDPRSCSDCRSRGVIRFGFVLFGRSYHGRSEQVCMDPAYGSRRVMLATFSKRIADVGGGKPVPCRFYRASTQASSRTGTDAFCPGPSAADADDDDGAGDNHADRYSMSGRGSVCDTADRGSAVGQYAQPARLTRPSPGDCCRPTPPSLHRARSAAPRRHEDHHPSVRLLRIASRFCCTIIAGS